MRLVLSSHSLLDGLQTVSRARTARTANPILEGMLIEGLDGCMRVTASDERMTIVTSIPCEVEKTGAGVIPGKLFIEIVRKLQENANVELRMNDRFLFTITSGASVINLAGQDSALYPVFQAPSQSNEITLPQSLLREMILKTEFAIASDDAREVLTGALLEIQGGEATMVALDGFRMAYKREKCSDVLDRVCAIVPGRAVGDLGKLLAGGDEDFATLAFENGRMEVHLDKTDIYIALIAGQFIDYRRIVPTSFRLRAVARSEALRQSIERAALLAREGTNNLIRFFLHDGVLEIDSSSPMGDAHEEMELAQMDGQEMKIAFNVRYMQDVMRTIDAEEVEMHFTDSLSPCVISPADDEDYVHLVLPVRTGG